MVSYRLFPSPCPLSLPRLYRVLPGLPGISKPLILDLNDVMILILDLFLVVILDDFEVDFGVFWYNNLILEYFAM